MIPAKTIENMIWLKEQIEDDNNVWHCDKCKRLLPFFMMLVKSKVKIGEKFYVKCRKCKNINERVRREAPKEKLW